MENEWGYYFNTDQLKLKIALRNLQAKSQIYLQNAFLKLSLTINNDLNSLDLQHCNLTQLGSNIFNDLSNLEYLFLGYNELNQQDSRIFHGLSKLKELEINDHGAS